MCYLFKKEKIDVSIEGWSPNLITYLLDRLEIDEDTDLQNMSICQSDLIVCQLKMDSKFGLMQNTVMNRKHSDFCDFCGESIVLTKGAMDASFVDPETGILEDCEVKEFMVHKHFGTTEGYVADKSLSFVKFALNCYHRKTMRRLSLNSCICKACYIILLRKYEASKKDKYYTPHKKGGKKETKCFLPFCENMMARNVSVLKEIFKTVFVIECGTSAPLCHAHRLAYANKLKENEHCPLCAKLLKYGRRCEKSKPTQERKTTLLCMIKTNNLNNMAALIPEDFESHEYEVHKKCIRKLERDVERSMPKSETPSNSSPTKEKMSQKKKRRLFDEIEMGDQSQINESMEQDLTEEINSDYSMQSLEESVVIIPEEEEENDFKRSKQSIMLEIDSRIVDFLLTYLKNNSFITRKQLLEKYENYLRTECILNNISTLGETTMRGDRMQRRLETELSKRELPTPIKFSFLSNKNGYLVHQKELDFKKWS